MITVQYIADSRDIQIKNYLEIDKIWGERSNKFGARPVSQVKHTSSLWGCHSLCWLVSATNPFDRAAEMLIFPLSLGSEPCLEEQLIGANR